jgi:hypothetical protein
MSLVLSYSQGKLSKSNSALGRLPSMFRQRTHWRFTWTAPLWRRTRPMKTWSCGHPSAHE